MADTSRTPADSRREPIAFDDRTRRVMELRRQVRAGTYRTDPRAIARAILSHWFQMGLELEREDALPAVETREQRRGASVRFVVPQSPPEPDAGGAPLTA